MHFIKMNILHTILNWHTNTSSLHYAIDTPYWYQLNFSGENSMLTIVIHTREAGDMNIIHV